MLPTFLFFPLMLLQQDKDTLVVDILMLTTYSEYKYFRGSWTDKRSIVIRTERV